jgi:Rrf2 family protein
MRLSLKSEYAVRTMLHLAAMPSGTLAQISNVSEEWNIPDSYLRRLIPVLTRSGLISSRIGGHGGISLNKSATSITLLDVIEAMEGPLYFTKCVIGPETCNHTKPCMVHSVWSEAQDALRRRLLDKSLAELVAHHFEQQRDGIDG